MSEMEIDFVEKRARGLAIKAHAGQFRRDGKTPYINHVGDVASRVSGTYRVAVAWLHDVFEDTKLTEADLREIGFPEPIVTAVSVLTKHPGEDYDRYIYNVKADVLARTVKIADILSNLSDTPTAKQVKKYARALTILLS